MDLQIINNRAKHYFETSLERKTAFIDYKMKPGIIMVLHTEVPEELEGRGIAAQMTKYVLDYLTEEKLQLVPPCSYITAYLKKHPEYPFLVKPRD